MWYIFSEAEHRLTAGRPVSRSPIQSGASSIHAERAHTSGSFSLSHIALKTNHSADAGSLPSPLYRRAQWSISEALPACSLARTSAHMIAFLKGLSASSRATSVADVASKPMPAI